MAVSTCYIDDFDYAGDTFLDGDSGLFNAKAMRSAVAYT
jgi:hypothetical protein